MILSDSYHSLYLVSCNVYTQNSMEQQDCIKFTFITTLFTIYCIYVSALCYNYYCSCETCDTYEQTPGASKFIFIMVHNAVSIHKQVQSTAIRHGLLITSVLYRCHNSGAVTIYWTGLVFCFGQIHLFLGIFKYLTPMQIAPSVIL